MWKKDMKEEIAWLRDVVMTQGREIVAMMLECESLREERDKAVKDIRLLARMEFACPVCAYYNHGEGKKGECVKCLTGDGFRWRGEKEEEK